MTLQEAIEIKQVYHNCHSQQMTPKEREADNLSIEAIKFTLAVRGTILNYATLPLPGETKD